MLRTITSDAPSGALARFLAVTFALGFALQLGAVALGVKGAGGAFLLATMWAPTLGVLAAGGELRARALAAARRVGWRWLPLAFLLGVAPQLLQKALLTISGHAAWDAAHLELAPDGGSVAAVHGLGMVLGVGPQGYAFLAANLALSVLLGALLTAVVGGFGEELGWRGLLQPELERRLGRLRGTILTGAVWAAWHLPANLAGYNDERHPAIGALLVFPLLAIGLSAILAALTRRSRSVWPAALAHGATNTIGASFLVEPTSWGADQATSLAAMAIVVALVVALDRR